MRSWFVISAFGFISLGRAVVFGQLDTFASGLENWAGSSPALGLGGPAGGSDQYLRLQSGPGFAPKMAARNQVQWTGNFAGAGVSAVTLNVANFGTSVIELRVALFAVGGLEYTSTTSTSIAADGQWRSISFSLAQSALTSVGANTNYAALMAGVTNFQFRNNPGAPSGSGTQPNFTGIMGLDNVRAVPEPSTVLALGFGGLMLRRRFRMSA
ncbi:MAG: PEP-CTERM sorting domain-containing protein [Fimbriimonadaceae bacterium]